MEAALAIMAVPERELLAAVDDIDRLVDVERHRDRWRGIARAVKIDEPPVSRTSSRVVGAFSQRLIVGRLARPITPPGSLPSASLSPGS